MSTRWLVATLLAVAACIAPSVVDPLDRAPRLAGEDLEWSAADETDLPGIYVSTGLSGPIAAVLRQVVYLFEGGGTYTGAGLVDDAPPHFEVISGLWNLDGGILTLDGGPQASVDVAQDGSLRLTGQAGTVVLRREKLQ